MGTKLKNFSRSAGAKTAIYALIVLMMVCGLVQMLVVFVSSENGDINLEVLGAQRYEDSSAGYKDAMDVYYRVLKSDVVINTNDFYYAIKKDGKVISNARHKEIRSNLVFVIDENGGIHSETNRFRAELINLEELLEREEAEFYSGYFAFSDEYLQAKQDEWSAMDRQLRPLIIAAFLQVVIFIFLLVMAALVAGRKYGDDEVHLVGIDKIYSDVMFAAAVCILVGWAAMTLVFMRELEYSLRFGEQIMIADLGTMQVLMMLMLLFVTVAAASLLLSIYLSLFRKIKARRLLKHTLIWTACYRWFWKTVWCKWIWGGMLRIIGKAIKGFFDFFFSIVDGRRFERYPFVKKMFARQLGYTMMQSVLLLFILFAAAAQNFSFVFLMLLISTALALYYIRSGNRIFEDMTKICSQISEINDGNFGYLPGIEENSLLHVYSEKLNSIRDGMKSGVDKAVKSERMKIDLITNVSHDLKTPLTSIISYVDLLAKSEGLTAEARDYVIVLAQKADRLKHIVADLFDLAKTTSGNIELNLEILDFKKLIEQTLADMEDNIKASGRIMRVKLPDEPVLIKSDGKKLYRVLQNVIDNALKYSMENTRIYIELENRRGRACASVKNTAGFEMEFTAEEVMERFSRGDKSRSTDGSGLGLSIAKSFTKATGGDFEVFVDGDLFKAVIEFES